MAEIADPEPISGTKGLFLVRDGYGKPDWVMGKGPYDVIIERPNGERARLRIPGALSCLLAAMLRERPDFCLVLPGIGIATSRGETACNTLRVAQGEYVGLKIIL